MTNIEKVNKALAGADENKIKEVLDFLGYKEDSKFIPKHGGKYYYITFGTIDFYTWTDNEYDNHSLLMGNVHRTKEEAKQALDFQTRKAKLIKEIEDSSDVIDWGDIQQYKYFFWLDGRYDSLRLYCNSYIQTQGAIYTTNGSFLEELIKTRSDEIKELLFDIKP